MEARIDGLEARIDGLEGRIDGLEAVLGARLETAEHRIMSRLDERLAAQARAMALQTWAILGAVLVALVGTIVTAAAV